jgi:DNA-directed RNA polymerase specialized sigma24 family protein
VQSNEEPTDGEMDAATQRLVEFLRHRLRHRWRNHPFIDDAIQDALMALVQRAKQQERIDDPRGFCLTVANRRMIGYHRRARKAAWNEEVTSATARTPTTPVDLVPILESLRLSHATLRVLREILAGNRTNHGIARALGKDRRTVREHRAKIIEHLRRLLPPPERPCWRWGADSRPQVHSTPKQGAQHDHHSPGLDILRTRRHPSPDVEQPEHDDDRGRTNGAPQLMPRSLTR